MNANKLAAISSIVLGTAAAVASAAGRESLNVDPSEGQGVRIITAPATDSVAITTREMSNQAVRPYLAKVKVVTQILYLDPTEDYVHQDDTEGRLDENHWILKTQRLARSLSNPGVVIMYGNDHRAVAATEIKPHMILLKPPLLRDCPVPRDPKQQIDMPTVPGSPAAPQTPEAKEPQKVARAE